MLRVGMVSSYFLFFCSLISIVVDRNHKENEWFDCCLSSFRSIQSTEVNLPAALSPYCCWASAVLPQSSGLQAWQQGKIIQLLPNIMNVSTNWCLPLRLCFTMCFHCLNITMASFGFFQEDKKKKKVWPEHFKLVQHPNSKSPNGLQVQMVDSHGCGERKGGATLTPTMAVILSICKLCTLACFT